VKKTILIVFSVIVVLVGVLVFVFLDKCEDDWCFVFQWQKIRAADSFERCVNLGFPVTESYPSQCRAGDKNFVQSIPQTGLIVDTPKANGLAVSPLIVSGYVDGKDRWTGFEAQVGTVQLLDGNGKLLVLGILTATDENWMQFPINFSTTLTFSAPTTAFGALVFKNENPSGMPDYEREFRLSVKFK
jgi:hypothetical protein